MYPHFSDRMTNMQPSSVREIFKALSDPSVISLAGGNPSPLTFPARELGEISARMYADNATAFLQYGISEGYAPLIEKTKFRMANKFGIGGADDEVIITSGGEQGIDLVLKVLTNEGDTVLCEDPTFVGALNDIRSYATNIVGIPVDDDGMDIDALERALETEKNVKLIYTIPTFQNPSGVTMSLERRQRMYDLAVKHNVIILEDGPYFELRYSGKHIPNIKSLDKTGHVIFCGSYSKLVAPGLRVGYLIADKRLMPKIVIAKQCQDVHTPVYTQMLIDGYLENYDIDAHIADSLRIYTAQRDVMLSALDRHIGNRAHFTRPDGGLFVWCTLPNGISGRELCVKTSAKKVVCVPGGSFDPSGDEDKAGIRLNFSMPTPEQIETGIQVVAECLAEYL